MARRLNHCTACCVYNLIMKHLPRVEIIWILAQEFFFSFLPEFSFALVRQLSHCHVCVRLSVLLWSNLHLIVLHKGTIKWIWRWISVHICLMDSNKWSDRIWLKKNHTHHKTIWQFWTPLFFVSLWHLTNICGLHDLVISPQWSPFGFGPLVAPFWGVHTPSDTHK